MRTRQSTIMASARESRAKDVYPTLGGRNTSAEAVYLNVTICMTQAPPVSGDVAL